MAERGAGGGRTGLPASIEAAWGLRERPAKGPKPGLSLDRIVGAAVAIAAEEGLPAVSMGRVAKALGVSTMSLYRYVAAKDELYVLMQEAALGPPPPAPRDADWREALTAWARAQREVLLSHLWALRIPVSGPPATPNMVAWWEQGLVALETTGLDDGAKISVILLVSGFVRSEATMMADLDTAVRAGGTPEEFMARHQNTLARLADPERYPSVARLLGSGVMTQPDEPGYEFAFGLERILDGVAVLIEARRADGEG
ncbi:MULTISPECIES: TetR/AcrR family transcriptional regulator C-terminal domain-containing protein [unclassified Streptomyces]|uniref:TetR/AcrR family transcriptional regulator C-terminal domain-containing protein n=1 Tax=unclassified Streptomyces TaxID=2593676 RepID=UPI00369FB7F9